MDAFTKPKRPHQADDRLSALPDELLHAILSRLKALQMAQTCVLSTRWRNLWRAVPCLDIDDGDFTSGPPYFHNFITNLLRRHSVALLEDFRLHASWGRWDWDLVRNTILQDMGTSSWPCRLKTLRLSNLDDLKLNDLANHINSRCPALEELQLEKCFFLTTGNVKIASSSLKKLVIDFNYDEDDGDIFALIIEAPVLVSLCLTADELVWILDTTEPHTMPSLVDASIQLDFYFATTAHESCLLAALYNVTSLHLSDFAFTLLDYSKFPLFDNLRTLSLDKCRIAQDFMGLEPFLRNSPHLQKLTLRQCEALEFTPNKDMKEHLHNDSQDSVYFKCESLRLSEIIYKDGDASVHVHLLVKFLVGMWRNLPNNKIELTKID